MSIANAEHGAVPDRLRALFEHLPDAVLLTIPETTIVAANPTACALFGMTEEELVRRGRDGLADPGDPRHAAFVAERRRTGRAIGWELRYVRAGGERFVAETTSVLMDGGRSAFVVLRDLSAQKRAEAQLRASEAEFRSVFEQAAIGMGRVRFGDARWIDVNDAFCRMLGRSREEMLRTPWPDITHPEDVDLDLVPFREMAAGKLDSYTVEKRFLHADGHAVWAKLTLSLVRDASGAPQYEIAIIEDVSDRKRVEEAERAAAHAAQESRSTLSAALASMTDAVLIADAGGRPIELNEGFATFHRFRSKSDCSLALAEWPRIFEVISADGALAPVAEWPLARALRGETMTNVVYRLHRKDTGESWIGSYSCAPIRDEAGRIAGAVAVARDITDVERGREALRAANEALREADRRKDEFLGMLSHELRNPLAPIRNALYILDRAAPGGQQARRAKDIASRQVAHLTRLVDDLLDVTRIARGKIELRREPLDLAALVRRTAEDYRPLMQDRGLDLAVDVPARGLTVNGDPARLTQVFGNLLNNAAKFTPPGGRVTLGLRAEGDRAVVHVRDTGPGISPDVLPTLFEPFTQGKQTLARSEGGLGLGLSLVKGLVALHGGDVTVTRAPGGGAEFAVGLPLAAPARAAARAAPAAAAPQQRRVLVIDDNHDAAETVAELARMLGHEVDVAFDAFDGLAKVADQVPDVVFCDIGLPGMDGYEFARQLRAVTANHPVRLVALSGYAQPDDVARSAEAGFDAHLAKPADPGSIERLLA